MNLSFPCFVDCSGRFRRGCSSEALHDNWRPRGIDSSIIPYPLAHVCGKGTQDHAEPAVERTEGNTTPGSIVHPSNNENTSIRSLEKREQTALSAPSYLNGVCCDLWLRHHPDRLDRVVPNGACHGQPNLCHGGIQPHPRAEAGLRRGTHKPSSGFDASLLTHAEGKCFGEGTRVVVKHSSCIPASEQSKCFTL